MTAAEIIKAQRRVELAHKELSEATKERALVIYEASHEARREAARLLGKPPNHITRMLRERFKRPPGWSPKP